MSNFTSIFTTIVTMVPLLFSMTMGMIDVNSQELQYVADHLTDHKCSQLMDALHQTTFQLRRHHTIVKQPKRKKGRQKTCMSRLESWNEGPGRNMTVEYLSIRLTEIGLPKLSKKLSGLVMKETSDKLHRYFLDDPFKDMIPAKSAMVDQEDGDDPTKDQILDEDTNDNEDKDDELFASVIVLSAICMSLFACISVCILCPKAGQYVCQNACPQLCASCYDVIVDGCHRAWFGTKNNINRYMLVAPKGAGSGAALAI